MNDQIHCIISVLTPSSQLQSFKLDLFKQIVEKCYQLLVSGGRICFIMPFEITIDNQRISVVDMWNYLEKQIKFLPRELISCIQTPFKKSLPLTPQSFENFKFEAVCDFIIIMNKEQYKLIGNKSKIDITRDEFLKYTNNCWQVFCEEKNNNFYEELIYRLTKLYTYQDNIILDPFALSDMVKRVVLPLKRKPILFNSFDIKDINSFQPF